MKIAIDPYDIANAKALWALNPKGHAKATLYLKDNLGEDSARYQVPCSDGTPRNVFLCRSQLFVYKFRKEAWSRNWPREVLTWGRDSIFHPGFVKAKNLPRPKNSTVKSIQRKRHEPTLLSRAAG